MRLPALFTTALWLGVTAASTAMVWTATSIVADDVTDRAATVLARQDVVSELASAAEPATTSPTRPTTTTSTVASRGRGPAPVGPNAPLPTAPQPQQPAVTPAPASASTTAPSAPQAPPTTRPTSPPTTQASPNPSATYSTSGGVVRVTCNGFFIALTSAIPSNGYAVNVVAAGPVNVEVHFIRSGQDVSVKAVCFGQPIRYYEQNPPRQSP